MLRIGLLNNFLIKQQVQEVSFDAKSMTSHTMVLVHHPELIYPKFISQTMNIFTSLNWSILEKKYDMKTVILTLKLPIFSCLLLASAAYIQVRFRLEFIMVTKKMNPDQTAPLIWVHIVCNIGYLRT